MPKQSLVVCSISPALITNHCEMIVILLVFPFIFKGKPENGKNCVERINEKTEECESTLAFSCQLDTKMERLRNSSLHLYFYHYYIP